MKSRLPYKNGIVSTKTHAELKFGQSVMIIDSTPDLYTVKVHANSLTYIIAKEDLMITQ